MNDDALLLFHTHLREKIIHFLLLIIFIFLYVQNTVLQISSSQILKNSIGIDLTSAHVKPPHYTSAAETLILRMAYIPMRTVLDHCSTMRQKGNWFLKNKALKPEVKQLLVLFLSNVKSKEISWRAHLNATCIWLLKTWYNFISTAFRCWYTELQCRLKLLPPATGRKKAEVMVLLRWVEWSSLKAHNTHNVLSVLM